MMYNPFYTLLDFICYFLRIFASMFIRDSLYFSYDIFVWFGMRVILASQSELRSSLSLSIFGEKLVKSWY